MKKFKVLFKSLLLVLFTATFIVSCSDDDDLINLSVGEKYEKTIRTDKPTSIQIPNGSGNYSLVTNPAYNATVVEVSFKDGAVIFNGLKPGKTQVKIVDSQKKEITIFTVTVYSDLILAANKLLLVTGNPVDVQLIEITKFTGAVSAVSLDPAKATAKIIDISGKKYVEITAAAGVTPTIPTTPPTPIIIEVTDAHDGQVVKVEVTVKDPVALTLDKATSVDIPVTSTAEYQFTITKYNGNIAGVTITPSTNVEITSNGTTNVVKYKLDSGAVAGTDEKITVTDIRGATTYTIKVVADDIFVLNPTTVSLNEVNPSYSIEYTSRGIVTVDAATVPEWLNITVNAKTIEFKVIDKKNPTTNQSKIITFKDPNNGKVIEKQITVNYTVPVP